MKKLCTVPSRLYPAIETGPPIRRAEPDISPGSFDPGLGTHTVPTPAGSQNLSGILKCRDNSREGPQRARTMAKTDCGKGQCRAVCELIRQGKQGNVRITMLCSNGNCLRAINPDWMSCPYCGTQTRIGSSRLQEEECDHDFVIEGPFCIICGFSPEFGYRSERIGKRFVAIVLVVVLTLASLYLALLLANPQAIPEDRMFKGRIAYRIGYLLTASLVGLSLAIGWLVKLFARRPN